MSYTHAHMRTILSTFIVLIEANNFNLVANDFVNAVHAANF